MSREVFQPDCNAVGLYVHIPFCTAKCRYCGFYSEPTENYDAGALVSALICEISLYESVKKIDTVYIGGGSPSCLAAEQLLRLSGEISRRWRGYPEFTIEVNPGQVDQTILSSLRRAGINRLSIGAQSFIQKELDFLGRSHSVDSIKKAVRNARRAGFDNISLDLIFAVPGSTIDSWSYNLRQAIELDVQHISAYSLTIEEGTPLQRDVSSGKVAAIDEETDRQMYELAIDRLRQAGFKQYEISNFAKKGFECRHNLGYWANRPYIGIGPAAASYWQGTRRTNIADINKYIKAVEQNKCTAAESETLTPVEQACETAVLNLRRISGIDLEEFKNRTGFDALKLFAEPIERNKKSGLIEIADNKISLTRNALPIADSILCDFSAV